VAKGSLLVAGCNGLRIFTCGGNEIARKGFSLFFENSPAGKWLQRRATFEELLIQEDR